MKLAGVVVLYNPDDEVLKNIKTYLDELDVLFAIDNSEQDNEFAKKIEKYKKIKYISNGDNKGIAYALNRAGREAIKLKYDWLLTMDQDSSFNNNGLKQMKEFIEERNNKIVNQIILDSNKLGLITPVHLTEKNKNDYFFGISSPFDVMTSGNIINLSIYQKIGGFDDELFIDHVDFDYCLNLRKHGYTIAQLNYVQLNHKLGDMSVRKIFHRNTYVDNHNAIRRYYIVRNRNYVCDRYKDIFPAGCALERSMTKKELIKIWLYEKNKIKKTRAIIRGIKDYKKGIKGKYYER